MTAKNTICIEGHSDAVNSATGALTAEDLAQIWKWNGFVPQPVQKTVYQFIHEWVQTQPNASAICAWDGDITYRQLDHYVSNLAAKLFKLGVKPGVLVPICFDKSKWTTIVILGIIRTGAGFVLLDPALPEERLQVIVQQLNSALLLCSAVYQDLGLRLISQVITINSDFLEGPEEASAAPTYKILPSSIIYAVFTSGSTGAPKGVLVTHGNAASALHYQVELLGLNSQSRLYDFASYSFDGSINNAFTVLAAGGCLCVPSDNDRKNNLEQSICELRANVLDLTPSLAKLLTPERIPGIKLIIFAGEALHVSEARRWWGKVRVHNGYGPSECTATSTINSSACTAEEATRIGKGAGLITWIVDPDDHERLLPIGCVGELLLEGPLVGHGYLDNIAATTAAFVEDPKWLLHGVDDIPGRHGRMYKTGDLVRYNEDGSLTYMSRKDAQVKIRGQRVELGEIEHVLRSHESVGDAVVLLQHDYRQEPWIASVVTLRKADKSSSKNLLGIGDVEHTDFWGHHFDNEAYTPIENLSFDKIGRDFIGWTSMINGSEIDKGEMNEWVDDTITTILNCNSPGYVLEIGSGSGMILFNLANTGGLQGYFGLDPSERAVNFINKTVKSIPPLADKVQAHKGTATDLPRLNLPFSPNLVVMNSVIQYFPSQNYLLGVLKDLSRLPDVKTIFIGDIRSYPLHKQFLAAKALHLAGPNPTKEIILKLVNEMEKKEAELLIDPGFFASLPSRLPDQVEHVEILPKKMNARNELSCYRYAAVIYTKSRDTQRDVQCKSIADDCWVDFTKQRLSRDSLAALLHGTLASATNIVALSNIPHSKTIFERHLVGLLETQDVEGQNDIDWMSLREAAQNCPSLSAMDIIEIADQTGYQVEISWARQHSIYGGLDAIFHRSSQTKSQKRTMFQFPTDFQGRSYQSLTNQPQRQSPKEDVKSELYRMLQKKLPVYMVPRNIAILDEMPLNKNGKIDRPMLAKSIASQKSEQKPVQQPKSELEHRMQMIWGQVLDIEPSTVRLDDHFFSLGGNSIAAMRLVQEARMTGLMLTVADIYSHPRLQDVARQTRVI